MVGHFLTDLVAALLQLQYAPLQPARPAEESSPPVPAVPMHPGQIGAPRRVVEGEAERSTSGTLGTGPEEAAKRGEAETLLQKLMQEVHPLMLVETLMQLLSSTSAVGGVPWLSKVCGHLLTRTTMRPMGVQAVYELMMGQELDPNVAEARPAALAKVVKLISTVPKQAKVSSLCLVLAWGALSAACRHPLQVDRYYMKIGPQLVAILRLKGERAMPHRQAAAQTIHAMTVSRPGLAQQEIYRHMLQPLLQMAAYEGGEATLPPGDPEQDPELRSIVAEEDLNTMIDDLYTMLNHDTPSEHVLAALTPVLPHLFRLFCAATMGKANVRAAARQIVQTYFRLAPTAAADLTALIIPPGHLQRQTAVPLVFAPGPSGGLQVRQASSITTWRDFEQEAECAVELLEGLQKEDLSGDVFICLLEEVK